MDILNWIPQYLLETENKADGETVTGPEWNRVWNLHRVQGDHNSETIYTLLELLKNGYIFDAVNGVRDVKHPFLTSDTEQLHDTVSKQLVYLDDQTGTAIALANAFLLALGELPQTHNEWPDRDAVDAHPISAITGLQDALDNLVAGELSAINHNLLPARDAVDAHPQSAITGLPGSLASIWQAVLDLSIDAHNDLNGRDVAACHPAAAIGYDGDFNVYSKIANLEAVLQGITGGVGEISHANLSHRSDASQHPISAITGLQTALDGKVNTVTLANYQTKVLTGTGVPAAGLGNNGDIYIRYA